MGSLSLTGHRKLKFLSESVSATQNVFPYLHHGLMLPPCDVDFPCGELKSALTMGSFFNGVH